MLQLNLPIFQPKLKKTDGELYIFDQIRKRYLILTPEEWVRQHCIEYLTTILNIPTSRIAVERGIKALKLNKRFDIVAFNQLGKAEILIECKAPQVEITQETVIQASVYNKTVHSSKLWITNGINHVWLEIINGELTRLPLPTKG